MILHVRFSLKRSTLFYRDRTIVDIVHLYAMQSSGSVQSIGGRAILLSLCVSNQCDKIGQLLKSLGDIVSYKISPYRYWSTFCAILKTSVVT